MNWRQFGIAALFSIALAIGVILALGGSKELLLGRAIWELPVIHCTTDLDEKASPDSKA